MNAETFSPVRLLSFLFDRRLPRLGGRCQAMVSCLMGMLYPFSLVRQWRGGWFGGLATCFVHIFWMVLRRDWKDGTVGVGIFGGGGPFLSWT